MSTSTPCGTGGIKLPAARIPSHSPSIAPAVRLGFCGGIGFDIDDSDGGNEIRALLSRGRGSARRQAGSEALQRLRQPEDLHLLLRGQATAKANGRDVIEPHDLPITKGLQESIQAFGALDEDIELKAILDHITARPPLHLAIGAEAESKLADIAGGLSVALAHILSS